MANKTKPTALKVLHGNPGKRKLPENEPKLAVEIPRAPAHLSPVAKQHFPKVAKQLAAAKVMTALDADALAAYCECYATWIEANINVQLNGTIEVNEKGMPIQSPYIQISFKAVEMMRKMLIEFGMTPSSRAKVQTVGDGKGTVDPWSQV